MTDRKEPAKGGVNLNEPEIQDDESPEQQEQLVFEDPRTGFIGMTCETCLYEKSGRCMRYPATEKEGSGRDQTHKYGSVNRYPLVARSVKHVDNNEDQAREYNDACGEYVSDIPEDDE